MTQTDAVQSEATKALDVARVRGDFPILRRELNGRPLVYLDNAASTQKPRIVIETIDRYYREYNANVHRGVHQLSVEATDAFEAVRARVQHLLGAAEPEEIIYTRGTTEAHGGIGYTWECEVHFWLKRALQDRAWLGAPRVHRLRAADLAGW